MVRLIDEILSKPIGSYPDVLEAWLSANLPTRNRREGQSPAGRPTRTARQANYCQRYTESSLRADAFKKAQDLYKKDNNMLADIIFSGSNILEPSTWPSIQDTEQYFAETLSMSSIDNAPVLDPKTAEHTPQPITPEEDEKAKARWKK